MAFAVWSPMPMHDNAASPAAERGVVGRMAPEVFAGLGALARVSRALVGTGSLAELAERALGEMRAALDLELAVLYLPRPATTVRCLDRFVSSAAAGTVLAARDELRYEPEAWRLAVASGMPIVLREEAGWLGPNPFTPPAHDWCVLPLVTGHRDMVGVVVAAARAPIALDPVSATVLALLGEQLSAGITTARLRQRLQRAEMEQERRSLAADVHDGLAQDLAVALRELALLDEDGHRRGDARAPAASGCARRSPARTGSCARAWRTCAPTAPLGGLRAAVEATVERFERGGLPVRLTVHGPVGRRGTGDGRGRLARARGGAGERRPPRGRARRRASTVRVEGERLELVVDDDGGRLRPARRGRARRRPLRPRDHARARARLRRRLRDRAAAGRRDPRRARGCRWPDGRRRARWRAGVEAGWCPHLAILVPGAAAVVPALASFYGLGARRNGWLFHRALPGQADADRAALDRRRARRRRAGGRRAAAPSPSRRSRADRERWAQPWVPVAERARSRAASRRRGSRASRSGPSEDRFTAALAYDRAWDEAFHGRPAVSLCVYIVDERRRRRARRPARRARARCTTASSWPASGRRRADRDAAGRAALTGAPSRDGAPAMRPSGGCACSGRASGRRSDGPASAPWP